MKTHTGGSSFTVLSRKCPELYSRASNSGDFFHRLIASLCALEWAHDRTAFERPIIELLFLPAYSPNLNLIERLWKLVKKRTLTNRYYDCFDKFRLAIDACLENLNGPAKSELDSLLTLNFQFFKTSSS